VRLCVVDTPKRPHTKNSHRLGFPKNAPRVMVYEALAGINGNFEQVLKDLEQLGRFDLFPARWQRNVFKVCRATLEEARAWANFDSSMYSTKEKKENGFPSPASASGPTDDHPLPTTSRFRANRPPKVTA